MLIASYIDIRDFARAIDVISFMNFEEDFVRNRGVRVFTDVPDERNFQDHQYDMIARERLEIERSMANGQQRTNDYLYYDKDGNCHEDIFAYRRLKYDVITATETVQSEIFMDRAEMHQEIINSNNARNELTRKRSISDQYVEFMKKNTHDIPEFGLNFHTFTSLVLSPYLNIVSRGYYASDKHVSHESINFFFF